MESLKGKVVNNALRTTGDSREKFQDRFGWEQPVLYP